jgi:hemolysin activation/secretion protein
VRYPFLRSQSANLRGAGGIDYVNQTVSFADLPLTRDRLRVAYLRLDLDALDNDSITGRGGYTAAEPRWRAAGSVELRRGLAVLDATDRCDRSINFVNCLVRGATPPSRIEGDPTATVIRASGFAEFRPAPGITVGVVPSAQYSRSPLLSYEEISGGNYTFGRGYDAGTIIGDSGFGFQSEIRYGSISARRPGAIAIQPFAFFDMGRVWNRDLLNAARDPQKLESVGGGLRMALGDRLRLDTAVAFPLRRAGLQTEKPDPRLLISLTSRLLPW